MSNATKPKIQHIVSPVFDSALRQILTVSKDELLRRQKQYQAERADKPKRGPKSKSAVSDRVSD